jgi:hypothetical protein
MCDAFTWFQPEGSGDKKLFSSTANIFAVARIFPPPQRGRKPFENGEPHLIHLYQMKKESTVTKRLIYSASWASSCRMAGNDTRGGANWQSKFGQSWKQSDNRGFYLGWYTHSTTSHTQLSVGAHEANNISTLWDICWNHKGMTAHCLAGNDSQLFTWRHPWHTL